MIRLKGIEVLHVMLMLFCMAIVLTPSQGAEAKIFKVNSTEDMVDATPGDAVCMTATGVCTLTAIQEANALPGADEIMLKAGTYRLPLIGEGEDFAATGDLDIKDSVTIAGKGAALTVVDGHHSDRVFQVFGTATVAAFVGLKIQNGVIAKGGFGGGVCAISSNATVNGCTITENSALAREDGAGKGMYLDKGTDPMTITINNLCRVTSNHASFGGGLYLNGAVALNISADSVVANNMQDNIFPDTGLLKRSAGETSQICLSPFFYRRVARLDITYS
jgi:hypothetical protein